MHTHISPSCELLKMGQPRHIFLYFCSFQEQFYRNIVDFSRIQTRVWKSRRRARWPSIHHQGPSRELLRLWNSKTIKCSWKIITIFSDNWADKPSTYPVYVDLVPTILTIIQPNSHNLSLTYAAIVGRWQLLILILYLLIMYMLT